MYWIYIIDNMYCIVDLQTNMIIAKFLYLDSAVKYMNYLKNQANANSVLNNLNYSINWPQNNNFNNEINNSGINSEDKETLNHLNNELKKINEKLDSMSSYRKKQLEDIFLLKPIYNDKNEVENLETAKLNDLHFNDNNLDISSLDFESIEKNKN